jgi:hypothetical protein
MTSTRRTQAEMLDGSRAAGFDPHPKLIERYVTVGLLDQAQPGGRGQGGGRGGHWTWPDEQYRLWLTLLHHRRTSDRPRVLANIPVAIWLYWGEGYVPLRQVRRAMETFAAVNNKRDVRRDYRQQARHLVRSLARPRANPRAMSALVDALSEAARSRTPLAPETRRLFIEVVGPAAPDEQLDGERAYLMLRARWEAITRFCDLTDAHFRWARAFHLTALAGYIGDYEGLASDHRFGAMHQPVDLQTATRNACRDVLQILGMGLRVPPSPSLPEALRLEPWLEGRVQMHSSTPLEADLLLPRKGQLNVEVNINVSPSTNSRGTRS